MFNTTLQKCPIICYLSWKTIFETIFSSISIFHHVIQRYLMLNSDEYSDECNFSAIFSSLGATRIAIFTARYVTWRLGGVKWWEGCDVLWYVENKINKKVKLTVILICTSWILGCHLLAIRSPTLTSQSIVPIGVQRSV